MKDLGETSLAMVADVIEGSFRCVLFLRLRAIVEDRFKIQVMPVFVHGEVAKTTSMSFSTPIGLPSAVQTDVVSFVSLKTNRIHVSSN